MLCHFYPFNSRLVNHVVAAGQVARESAGELVESRQKFQMPVDNDRAVAHLLTQSLVPCWKFRNLANEHRVWTRSCRHQV